MLFLRMARAVFKGTKMVNAKGSNGHYRSRCKRQEFPSKSEQKALVFKKNRSSSLLEKCAESQISKSNVAWICDACRQ